MRRRLNALAVLGAVVATTAAAQAPIITPGGDPSVKSDTIYRLASDSLRYSEESQLVLLDDGVVTLEANGRARRTYRQVVQILREDAVDNYQEHSFSWVPGRQKLTVNWFKVLTPTGSVISDKPAQVQDSDVLRKWSSPCIRTRV